MWYINAMEYYSAIKKNKIMPFAAIWVDLEIITLSEVRQRKTNIWYHSYVESISLNDINELICKPERDLQISKQMYGNQRVNMGGKDKPGV